MMGTSILLPVAALYRVGGPLELWSQMQQIEGFGSLGTGDGFFASMGFIAGLLGIGLGYPGQPHVVNRFMALKDEKSMARGRQIAIGWAVVVYSGMLILGWCGRILYPGLADKEVVFLTATTALFPPIVAGIMIAAVVSAIMSTADSQLLVLVSSLTHDMNLDSEKDDRLLAKSRAVILVVSAVSVMVALYGPTEIFKFVLFAWSAMGAAFGPLLLITVLRGRVNARATLAAMAVGFVLSVAFYLIPATKGGFIERVLPWCIAMAIGLAGSSKKDA